MYTHSTESVYTIIEVYIQLAKYDTQHTKKILRRSDRSLNRRVIKVIDFKNAFKTFRNQNSTKEIKFPLNSSLK